MNELEINLRKKLFKQNFEMEKIVFSSDEIEILKNNLEIVIDIFCKSHEELKEELTKLDEENLSYYFSKCDWDKNSIDFEKNKFFSLGGAKDTYHNYYCYVFASIMKDLFKNFFYYERFDGIHVAIGCEKYIFDVCGVYYESNGKICDFEGNLYWDATDDEWFMCELKYFGRLKEELETRLKKIFYHNLKSFLKKDKIKNITLHKKMSPNN